MSLKNLFRAPASGVESSQKTDQQRRPGASDEYAALRTEMTHIHVSVRTLWASLFVVFVAGASALLGLTNSLIHDKEIETFIRMGGLSWASAIFISILVLSLYLAYLWLRQVFYISAYIIAVHEADNGNLQWLTRNSSDFKDKELKSYSVNLAASFARSSIVLLVFALLPGIIGIIWVVTERLSPTRFFWVGSIFMGVLVVLFFINYSLLRKSTDERHKIQEAWKRELKLDPPAHHNADPQL